MTTVPSDYPIGTLVKMGNEYLLRGDIGNSPAWVNQNSQYYYSVKDPIEVIYTPPKQLKVGDIVTWEEACGLPPKSIVRNTEDPTKAYLITANSIEYLPRYPAYRIVDIYKEES